MTTQRPPLDDGLRRSAVACQTLLLHLVGEPSDPATAEATSLAVNLLSECRLAGVEP
jgi:hypothetical protein